MQKNDKFYTFLLSHSSKSGIYIKRIAVRKSYLHFGSVGIFMMLGIATFAVGVNGLVRNPTLADTFSQIPTVSSISASPPQITETTAQSEPPAASELAFNSGGPEEGNEVDGEDPEIDNEIASIGRTADPDYLPTMWAHLGKINNEFGFRRNPFGGRSYEFHPGMDIDGERGDEVIAPANGTVIKAGWTGGYGNMVEIDHGNGLTTRYGHLSRIEAEVGEKITRGQLIGLVGSTGRSTGPHLHFELRLNDRSINPRHFLPPEPADLSTIKK
jgi:murein DD-endopeptidase MepM/ murein hydrolase activator NlpD